MDKATKLKVEATAADQQQKTQDDTEALMEVMIEAHLRRLSERLAGQHTAQELQAVVIVLSDLIQSFKVRSELVTRLLAKAQAVINKTAHSYGGYVLKVCGYCKGAAGKSGGVCPVCKDKGNVLMKEPAAVCPRCGGDGVNRAGYLAARRSNCCSECRGVGWVTVTQ